MMNYREFVSDPEDDPINTTKDWLCLCCYTKNWLSRDCCRNKDCVMPKKMFEPVSDDDWIKLKDSYSNEINDTNEWKFNKLSDKISPNATIYHRIIASQQSVFLQLAQNNPNLRFAIDLDTITESAISYARDLIRGSGIMDGNSVKEDTVNKFVSTLWHKHSLLFLKTSKICYKNDVTVMIEGMKNDTDKYYYERTRCVMKRSDDDDYDKSYEKIMTIIIKQSDDPELCDRIRESIIKKYSKYITKNTCSLTYPIHVKKHLEFIEDPFFPRSDEYDHGSEWVNDESELWSFILKKYVYDDVKLCVEIIDDKHVRFCWAWTDHSW